MFSLSNWPFYPNSLSEVIDPDLLSVIETGSSERLRRPLTILDFDPSTGKFTRRIEAIEEMRRYEDYCRCLRSTTAGNQACLQWDLDQANLSLEHFRATGELYRCFHCHMQLLDMSYILTLFDRPVALLLTGQYCPPDGAAPIAAALERAAQPGVDGVERARLLRLAEHLRPAPPDFRSQLEREAASILRFAESEFRQRKIAFEQVFLDELRLLTIGEDIRSRDALVERMERLLSRLRAYVHCKYLVLFSAVMEDDTVLAPLAADGLPGGTELLPHFNWRKANLPVENFDLNNFDVLAWRDEALARGVRGKNSQLLNDAALVIPVSLNGLYRGALVFGPFTTEVNPRREERFLKEAASVVGLFCLSIMQVIALDQERSRWHNTARLLAHELKTALTPISTNLGRARAMLRKPPRELEFSRLDFLLRQTEDETMSLADTARETLSGSITLLSHDDLACEDCHLSTLVANVGAGFIDQAEAQNREIDVDRSIEMLPEAEVDIPRLTIALQNLLENALKYSYADTTIRLRSRIDYGKDPHSMIARIEISDLGREIRQNELESIFGLGVRGSNTSGGKSRQIPGTGLGLWQTRSIIQAHGGSITATCEPTNVFRRERRAYLVVFTVILPLNRGD